jgi:hypothetical protein
MTLLVGLPTLPDGGSPTPAGQPAPLSTRVEPRSIAPVSRLSGSSSYARETRPPGAPGKATSIEPQSVPAASQSDDPASLSRKADNAAPPQSSSHLTMSVTCYPNDGRYGPAIELQQCLDLAPPFTLVEIPRDVYVLDRQVVIRKPLTVRTAGSEDGSVTCSSGPESCANLVASPDFRDDYGVLLIASTEEVTLEHVVLDGNRRQRLSSRAAQACVAGRNAAGFTAAVVRCTRCALRDVVARHAVCGTGMLWSGSDATIERSDFRDNGDSATRMWADGLTAVYAPDSRIVENRFFENSDVGLILGYGVRTRVEGNHIRQREQSVFAGLMLDNFNSDDLTTHGDFRDALITRNTIDCRPLRCLFGIQVGPHPWYPTRNIIGGKIWENQIHGAKVGINVDGGGVARAPVAIFSNRVTDLAEGAYFVTCDRPLAAEWMNVAPTSVVDRSDEVSPTGAHLTEPCQFWSPLGRLASGGSDLGDESTQGYAPTQQP